MHSDIEIAQACTLRHIRDIAQEAGIPEAYLEQYGHYKAKIDTKFFQENPGPDGKLVLVTAITPTPAGEGKTTTSVGLADSSADVLEQKGGGGPAGAPPWARCSA